MKKLLAIGALLSVFLVAGCSTQSAKSDDVKDTVSAGSQNNVESVSKSTNDAVKNLDFDKFFPDEDIRKYAKEMIGQTAPEFTLTNLKGEEVSLSDFKGKNVIVELAQTTCSACIQFQPEMDKFKADHPEIPVLQVFPLENNTTVQDYLTKLNSPVSDTILTGEKGNTMARDYKAKWTPTMYFIDKEGIISFVYVSDAEKEFVEDMVKLAFE
jgi:glutathione peroxidase-family protein